MAKRKTTQRRSPAALAELPEERQMRRLIAKHNLAQAKAALSTYAAADRGRVNKDWRASNVSADMAIIPDSAVLNARARQVVRDTSVGKAAVRAFVRNVVRCGIIPIPMARDASGKLMADLNKRILKDFWEWANNKKFCDVEEKQTFWAKQALCESERVTVGGALVVWSYEPKRLSSGEIDQRWPVGLKLQSMEYEQLDNSILTFNGNEVRGGIEVDDRGRAVAYHVWKSHPNDYGMGRRLASERIPAERVFHHFRVERVRQTLGATELAPVLQDMRDLARGKNANLWRMIMESCIGMVIKRETPTGPASRLGFPAAAGDTGQTSTGMRTIDFVPGMVPELLPGESIDPFIPQSPGNGYLPFTSDTKRGIAAGMGISNGQLTRQSEGNYSAARQDMLEDRSEFEPLQELLAHGLVLPCLALFITLSVAEGRYEIDDFEADPMRYLAAEYVAPSQPWIDPEKEINAFCKAIDYKLETRETIIALKGQRREDVWDGIEAEQKDAETRGIGLPEVVALKAKEPPAPVLPAPVEGGKPAPAPNLAPAEDDPAKAELAAVIPPEVPRYREAVTPDVSCGTCKYFDATKGRCKAYEFATAPGQVCFAWETAPVGEGQQSRRSEPPVVMEGKRPMDDPRGSFLDRGQRGVSS